MSAPVPTNLITGFLGSGKTTVIRHLLATARPRDERWAVLINESLEALRGCQRVKGVLRTGRDWLRVDADSDGVRATAAAWRGDSRLEIIGPPEGIIWEALEAQLMAALRDRASQERGRRTG